MNSIMSPSIRAVCFSVLLMFTGLLFSDAALAQGPNGTLLGTVSDQNGARIVGATITAQAVGSSLKRVTVTNSAGEYRIEGLPPGDYRVTVTATNFAPVNNVVRVTVNSSPTITVV